MFCSDSDDAAVARFVDDVHKGVPDLALLHDCLVSRLGRGAEVLVTLRADPDRLADTDADLIAAHAVHTYGLRLSCDLAGSPWRNNDDGSVDFELAEVQLEAALALGCYRFLAEAYVRWMRESPAMLAQLRAAGDN